MQWAQEAYHHLRESTGMRESPVGQYHYAEVTLRRALRFEDFPAAAPSSSLHYCAEDAECCCQDT